MKKPTAYRVPSLAECDPDHYGALIAKRLELHSTASEARKARKDAERTLAEDTSRDIRPSVAELLGDGPSAKARKRQVVTEARQRETDFDAALAVIEQRIRDARSTAVRKAITVVKPEFDRRLQALCEILAAADVAHKEFAEFCEELEDAEISIGHLGARPFFLGDRHDSKIGTFLKEVGYV